MPYSRARPRPGKPGPEDRGRPVEHQKRAATLGRSRGLPAALNKVLIRVDRVLTKFEQFLIGVRQACNKV